jgi:hypothetical protein
MSARTEFIQDLVNKCLLFLAALCDVSLYTYQTEIADRIFFSLLIEDSEEITAECARQSGKSETLSDVIATAMIIFPRLAQWYPNDPILQKFKRGVEIGCFAPSDFQADTIFGRVEQRLTSKYALEFLSDPEIDEHCHVAGGELRMRNGSICRKQTCHPKARIESKSYHLVVIDEAQDADGETVKLRVHPTMAAYAGTIVKLGTPSAHISDFYEAIQRNKLSPKRNGKRAHFAYNWKAAAKENSHYRAFMKVETKRLGEDSDEFQMAYMLIWKLERGMFMTVELVEVLGDKTMEIVPYYTASPIVMGIDVAKKHDSTVCTALWVDWEHPDEFGLFDCRILDWLELHGEMWESQYHQICNFVGRYRVNHIAVDGQGMGDPVAERLQILLPRIEVEPMGMEPNKQSERWKHLIQLVDRRLLGWPASPSAKATDEYQRFVKQITTVEKDYKNKYIQIAAPNDKNSHDDYIDSLALATWLTKIEQTTEEVEQWSTNPFMQRAMGRQRALR